MIGSKERQHGDRIVHLPSMQLKVLPIAVIYGGNASGKTNFFKALSFMKQLIVQGTHPDNFIPVEPFFDLKEPDHPSRFEITLLIDETVYEYGFSVTRHSVIEEKLIQVNRSSEKVLYHRKNNQPHFSPSLAKDPALEFAFKGTRNNQLFLTNTVSQNIDAFRPIYDWFKIQLELIAPDTRFGPFELFLDEGNPLYSQMNKLLSQLDTGISRLGGESIPFANLPLPETSKLQLQQTVKEGMAVRVLNPLQNDRFIVSRKNGELIAKKLVTYHKKTDGTESKFNIDQESTGSQRIINLLPAILEASESSSKRTFVIDEIDRSLHTLLTRQLVEIFLSSCSSENRSQLLVTTHDVLLMDQDLLRRDEMWLAERDAAGGSSLFSFSDFKDVRYDKDVRKSYLEGRLGGIPRIDA